MRKLCWSRVWTVGKRLEMYMSNVSQRDQFMQAACYCRAVQSSPRKHTYTLTITEYRKMTRVSASVSPYYDKHSPGIFIFVYLYCVLNNSTRDSDFSARLQPQMDSIRRDESCCSEIKTTKMPGRFSISKVVLVGVRVLTLIYSTLVYFTFYYAHRLNVYLTNRKDMSAVTCMQPWWTPASK